MRVIQKVSVPAYEPNADGIRTVIPFRLPKDSKILQVTSDLNGNETAMEFVIWFEGCCDDCVEFENHKLGIFLEQDPMPTNALRFHSVHNYFGRYLFIYEYICP